jgi:SAM-dependent methyltransferase
VLYTAGDLQWKLWSGLIDSLRTGGSAAERVLGKDMFAYMREHPEVAEQFNRAMAAISAMLSPPVVAAYDFSRFRCIADIGGGTGRQLADILRAHPTLTGILFDLPHVIDEARSVVANSGVSDRTQLETGSFFDVVPRGADAYVLKHVLHDWDDERAAQILAACRKAVPDDGRLLIIERAMPERAVPGSSAEPFLLDLQMLMMTPGGRERTEGEFRALLSGSGFNLVRVVPTTAPISVIEAAPES